MAQIDSAHVFANDFCEIGFDEDRSLLELRWKLATTRMGSDDFRDGLERFAELAECHRARRLLVDVSGFRYSLSPDLILWRDQEIAPRYNRAGVDRLAYVVREGFPIPSFDGKPLSKRELFRTRFFTSRAAAHRWLVTA